MYHQFAPSETKYGIIPAVKFDKHDSGASVEKIGTIQFNSSADLHGSIASVASTGKEIQYIRGDPVSVKKYPVKKYHSLIKEFEYEESDSLFSEFEQMNAGFIDDEEREISFVRWQTLHLLSVGNNTRKNFRIKHQRTPRKMESVGETTPRNRQSNFSWSWF